MDNSKYHDLDPSPCILILTIILFSLNFEKSVLGGEVNLKVYKGVFLTRDFDLCVYIYTKYMFYINVCMYVCVYVYM